MLHNPKGFIFDWDGTLADTKPVIDAATYATFKHFHKDVEIAEDLIVNQGRALRDTFPIIFEGNAEKAEEYFYAYILEHHIKYLKPLTGAEDVLKFLHAEGLPKVVVSNKRGDVLRKEIESLNWNKYFKAVVGSGDCSYDKPHPQPIEVALAKGGIDNTRSIWFIGDSLVDMACAFAAQCSRVLLGSSGHLDMSRFEPVLKLEDCWALKKYLTNYMIEKKDRK